MGDLVIHNGRRMTEIETRMAVNWGIKNGFETASMIPQETANCNKSFDNITKDSFAKERRLNIAAMMCAGLLANPNVDKEYKAYQTLAQGDEDFVTKESYVASKSLRYADVLLSECEKGGES